MKNIEKNKKVDSIQTELNFPDDKNKEVKKVVEKVVEKDSKGRTRDDIIEESGVNEKDQKFLDSIVFKNGEFYIYEMPADKWISDNKKIFGPKKEIKKEEENISDRARRKEERRENYLYQRD